MKHAKEFAEDASTNFRVIATLHPQFPALGGLKDLTKGACWRLIGTTCRPYPVRVHVSAWQDVAA